MVKGLEQTFSQKDIQMANKTWKDGLTSLIIRNVNQKPHYITEWILLKRGQEVTNVG